MKRESDFGNKNENHLNCEQVFENSEPRIADIINFLPDPTFVIDKEGRVIAWNKAIEEMTGIKARDILGKGNHEYAIPFYGFRRPILADLVLRPATNIDAEYEVLQMEGMNITGEVFIPNLGQSGSYIWSKAAPLYDPSGNLVGAIESLRDITEHKKANENLRESEAKFRLLFERSADAMFLLDGHKFIDCNEAALDIMKCSDKEELLNLHPSQTAPERQPDGLLSYEKAEEMMRIACEKGTHRFEWVRRRNNGEEFPVEATLTAIPWRGRQILHLIIRAITKRKRAEEALLKSERSYRLLAENVTDVIWTMDMDLKFTYISPSNVRMTGFSVEEAMALKLEDILTPISLESVNRVLAEELEIEKIHQKDLSRSRTIEVEEYCKGGHITWVEIRAAFLRDENGRPVGTQGISREITERKRAEEELQESKEYLNQIINSIGDPIFVKDREHRFVLVNSALCALIGRSQEELLGMTDYDFFPQHQADIFWQLDDKVFESGEENVNEEAITGVDDDVHTIITKKTLFTDRFGNKQIVGVIRDISERKRMEEELRRSRDELVQRVKDRTAELETKNAEMERFIYTVSHDLRAPLISVSGFLGFLKQDAERGDLKRLDADLRMIADSVTKMDNLLMNTLQLSRIGRVINPPTDIPFREIVEEALKQTAQKINSKGIKVSVAPDMPVVRADRMRITEVLINLLENSIKYIGPADKPEIYIGYRQDSKELILFVRDNGIGIDPSQQGKIFELFYKVNKNSEGTGAGLAIVKRIIEVHGGRIWVESELGNGCTVCFTLASPQTEDQVTE